VSEIDVAQNMRIWNKVAQPPKEVLKPIPAGRMKGKTSISPQWRYQAVTELFGPCGIGWKYTIDGLWLEAIPTTRKPMSDIGGDEIIAFARINLYIKQDDTWSDPIPGIGGSKLVAQEVREQYNCDEAYKMAVTDALSVAFKALGFGAAVHMDQWDGSKYKDQPIDEGKLADWLIAVEDAAEEPLEDFLEWWPHNKEKIEKDCGVAVAARIYSKYTGLLKKKRAEKKAAG